MPVRVHNFSSGAAPARIYQQQMPQQTGSFQAPEPPDYAGFGSTLADALNQRRKGMHPHAPGAANRMLNRKPLNAGGFRSTPAVNAPQGLLGFSGLRGLF